jgi:hypothetical protein
MLAVRLSSRTMVTLVAILVLVLLLTALVPLAVAHPLVGCTGSVQPC